MSNKTFGNMLFQENNQGQCGEMHHFCYHPEVNYKLIITNENEIGGNNCLYVFIVLNDIVYALASHIPGQHTDILHTQTLSRETEPKDNMKRSNSFSKSF